MLIVAAAVLLLVTVPLTGGKWRRLAALPLRWSWLLGLAIVLQVLVISIVPTWPRLLLQSVHVATYVLAAVFVARNWRVPGVPVITLGGALNAVTIAANHGTLPASRAALRRAGIHLDPHDFVNSGVLAHPHLRWLGDVFNTPSWLPLANVFSVGDVLIVAGLAWAVHRICRDPSYDAALPDRRSEPVTPAVATAE